MRPLPLLLLLPLLLCLISCDRPFDPADATVIDRATVWGGDGATVRVESDLEVRPSGTLEILPGTTVEVVRGSAVQRDPAGDFPRTPRFVVEGRILMEGTQSAPIRFLLVEGERDEDGKLLGNTFFDLTIRSEHPEDSRIAWTRIPLVDWTGGPIDIRHSTIDDLILSEPDSLALLDNMLGTATVVGGTGVIARNTVRDGLLLHGNAIPVTRTWFLEGYTCLLIGNGGTNRISQNTFDGCETSIEVFDALPTIQENDFANTPTLLRIRPNASRRDTGTVDATRNWWGTTRTDAIRSLIRYMPNGSMLSEKVIQIEPLARGPYGWVP